MAARGSAKCQPWPLVTSPGNSPRRRRASFTRTRSTAAIGSRTSAGTSAHQRVVNTDQEVPQSAEERAVTLVRARRDAFFFRAEYPADLVVIAVALRAREAGRLGLGLLVNELAFGQRHPAMIALAGGSHLRRATCGVRCANVLAVLCAERAHVLTTCPRAATCYVLTCRADLRRVGPAQPRRPHVEHVSTVEARPHPARAHASTPHERTPSTPHGARKHTARRTGHVSTSPVVSTCARLARRTASTCARRT